MSSSNVDVDGGRAADDHGEVTLAPRELMRTSAAAARERLRRT